MAVASPRFEPASIFAARNLCRGARQLRPIYVRLHPNTSENRVVAATSEQDGSTTSPTLRNLQNRHPCCLAQHSGVLRASSRHACDRIDDKRASSIADNVCGAPTEAIRLLCAVSARRRPPVRGHGLGQAAASVDGRVPHVASRFASTGFRSGGGRTCRHVCENRIPCADTNPSANMLAPPAINDATSVGRRPDAVRQYASQRRTGDRADAVRRDDRASLRRRQTAPLREVNCQKYEDESASCG